MKRLFWKPHWEQVTKANCELCAIVKLHQQCNFQLTFTLIKKLNFTHTDIQQLEIHLQSKKAQEQESRDPMVTQLQQMIDHFQNATDHLAATITNGMRSEMQHQLHIIVGK